MRQGKLLITIVLIFSLLCSLTACDFDASALFPEAEALREERELRQSLAGQEEISLAEPVETIINPLEKVELKKTCVNLAIVGDVLMHVPLITAAEKEDRSHDFTPPYRFMEEAIAAADYAAFNMEGTLAGEPWEGFPIFSCPDALAEQLHGLGFDLAYAANNHSMDRGVEGLLMTARKLKAAGLDLVGTRERDTDATYLVKEINGVKLGFINFTYESKRKKGRRTLNGHIIPEEAEGLVDSFSVQREPEDLFAADLIRIGERIDALQSEAPDFIIALIHWGKEYQNEPAPVQRELAEFLSQRGVDLIVGAHPHILQPIEWIYRADGSATLCYYSLGNFISNQHFKTKKSQGHAEDGLMALVQFEKNILGAKKLSKAGYISTYNLKIKPDEETTHATIIPVELATVDPAQFELDAEALELVAASYDRTAAVMAQNGEGIVSYKSFSEFKTLD